MKTHFENPSGTKAVIYCRMSSKKQTVDGSGLDSQEHRCRDYAAQHGYQVQTVLFDDMTGGGDFMKRPGMVGLLGYIDAQPHENFVVIFDDLKRFARDTQFHIKLRQEFLARGAKVECLNFNFEDTPEGRFVETVFAAQGELEREQNRRQVIQKMKARVEKGYWVFRAPIGYCFTNCKGGGKQLEIKEPEASAVREALEGFASKRFASQTEMRCFLEQHPHFPSDLPNGGIRPQTVVRLLRKVVYAGYVSAPKWGVSTREGKHAALISFATYEKNQKRLDEGVYAPTHKDIKEDLPLRGAVSCSCCDTPLTAGWSKGNTKSYPYYFCRAKGCKRYGKSIPRKKIEGEFSELLEQIKPTTTMTKLVRRCSRTSGISVQAKPRTSPRLLAIRSRMLRSPSPSSSSLWLARVIRASSRPRRRKLKSWRCRSSDWLKSSAILASRDTPSNKCLNSR